MSSTQKILIIAATCHTLNAALCAALGETQPSWEEAPENIRASAVAGVKYHLANPDVTPEQSHEEWSKFKLAEGWAYGPEKDVAKKIHPNLVPFAELSELQRAKDYLFSATVRALKDLPLDALPVVAGASQLQVAAVMATPNGFLPIQYIGKRETYRDGTYGTGLVFVKGETKPVPLEKAKLLLRHPDVYILGRIEEAAVAAPTDEAGNKPAQAEPDKVEEQLQDQRDQVSLMDKEALATYAQTNFGQKIDKRLAVAELRSQVTRLIDQFGVPK